ncbi:hypothetical protein T10_4358 [Trichinella papuae]|uniref:Integrase catalytic domain-containing protein n=1 Tax=Trichinella papuae TaxID=268474 RepID=A0A0V1MXQ5_9BILA|nr:hypothetical protein T10_4358 [Trichinella papuae]
MDEVRQLFATPGLLNTIAFDNAFQFTSEEFQQFLNRGTIQHARIAHFHPASNGQAKWMVLVTKDAFQKIIHDRLKNFLLLKHLTPCASIVKNQAELLMKHRLCLILDHMHPDLAEELVKDKINLTEVIKKKIRNFAADNLVVARNYAPGPKCSPASIVTLTGPAPCNIETTDGQSGNINPEQLRR